MQQFNLIDQNFQMKKAYILDATSYNPTDDGTEYDANQLMATYTFTPMTTDNVILGILWRCTLTTAGSFSVSKARLGFTFPTDLTSGDMTNTMMYSETFRAADASVNPTQWMWVTLGTAVTGATNLNKPLLAGQASYAIKLYCTARSSTDRVSNVEILIFYFDKLTGGINTITVA